jgi:hypothetical protein
MKDYKLKERNLRASAFSQKSGQIPIFSGILSWGAPRPLTGTATRFINQDSDVKFYHSKEAHGNRKDTISKENMYFAHWNITSIQQIPFAGNRWRRKCGGLTSVQSSFGLNMAVFNLYTQCVPA